MLKIFALIGLLAVCISCDKEENEMQLSVTELLTREDWILSSYGYDQNGNGTIEPAEENIRDCEKDNTYRFLPGGDGKFFENAISCGNGITDHDFNWQLTHNETHIDFVYGVASIIRIDENALVLTQANTQGVNLILRFVH